MILEDRVNKVKEILDQYDLNYNIAVKQSLSRNGSLVNNNIKYCVDYRKKQAIIPVGEIVEKLNPLLEPLDFDDTVLYCIIVENLQVLRLEKLGDEYNNFLETGGE